MIALPSTLAFLVLSFAGEEVAKRIGAVGLVGPVGPVTPRIPLPTTALSRPVYSHCLRIARIAFDQDDHCHQS